MACFSTELPIKKTTLHNCKHFEATVRLPWQRWCSLYWRYPEVAETLQQPQNSQPRAMLYLACDPAPASSCCENLLGQGLRIDQEKREGTETLLTKHLYNCPYLWNNSVLAELWIVMAQALRQIPILQLFNTLNLYLSNKKTEDYFKNSKTQICIIVYG